MLLNASSGDDQTPPGAFDAREHSTKYEYRIPMRDGGAAGRSRPDLVGGECAMHALPHFERADGGDVRAVNPVVA
jgi:hypothetical protein